MNGRSAEDFEMWEGVLSNHRTPDHSCTGLFVDGFLLFCVSHSNAHLSKSPEATQWKREEDEMNAVDTLEHHRSKYPQAMPEKFAGRFPNWQAWMMFLLPTIAKHYDVSKDALLEHWVRHHAPTIIYDQTGEIWMPKPKPALKPGEPCNHPGCLAHLSHPCEGCGRIAGGINGV